MSLTRDKCFNFYCNSWGCINGNVWVKKDTPATNWVLYMIEFTRYASGFDFDMYSNGIGIRRTKNIMVVK